MRFRSPQRAKGLTIVRPRENWGKPGTDGTFHEFPFVESWGMFRLCPVSSRAGPSQKTRRNGAPTVLVMPARSKAWATRLSSDHSHAVMNKVFFQRQRDLSIHLGSSIVDRTVAFSEHDGL